MSRDADRDREADREKRGLEIRTKVYPRMRRYIVQKRKGKRKRAKTRGGETAESSSGALLHNAAVCFARVTQRREK